MTSLFVAFEGIDGSGKTTVSAVVARLAGNGLFPTRSSPERMAKTVRADLVRFAAQVKALNIKVE